LSAGIVLKNIKGVEVNCTGVRPSAITGGEKNVLLVDGASITAGGRIPGGNLASGIIG
jgi:hypothetical protein